MTSSENQYPEIQGADRKRYAAPELVEYGTIQDLTMGTAGGGNDGTLGLSKV